MLAEENPILEDAAVTMYEMSAEDAIREQCQAREDYYRTMNTFRAEIQKKDREIEQLTRQLDQLARRLEQQDQQIARLAPKTE